MRQSALTGMMFGIGQGGSDAGLRIFAAPGTEDQTSCVRGFAEAYVRGRGLQGAQELMVIMP